MPPKPPSDLPPLKIYNSLTRTKTPFIPRKDNNVTWYTCGPTVYDDSHLGHARNYVTTDILRRIMRDYFKFDVRFVMNITDVDDKVGCSCQYRLYSTHVLPQIIIRARQRYLFSKYRAEARSRQEVLATATSAFEAYVKKQLPLVADVSPDSFDKLAEASYPNPDALIRMHLRFAGDAAMAITDASRAADADLSAFISRIQGIISPYLDQLALDGLGKAQSTNILDHKIYLDLTQEFEQSFTNDMRGLNVLDADDVVRVTDYMQPIVDFVDRIVHNKFGYATSDGSVYFDIEAFEAAGHPYARLAPWNCNDVKLVAEGEGSLTKKVAEKRSPADFALWKASRPGEPFWPSPWGNGRPGWHIECSAMASDKLGKQFDIHSGGIDLAFPHHDNELAQSEAYWHTQQEKDHNHEQWVNYFLHIGHLSIQGAKMSKSLKNFTTIKDALSRADWTPRSLRIVFLLGNWSDGMEITPELVTAGKSFEEKVNNFFIGAKDLFAKPTNTFDSGEILLPALDVAKSAAHDALCNSFDTPEVLSIISRLITTYNNVDKNAARLDDVRAVAQWITSMLNIFGLNGNAAPDVSEVGWQGLDIPTHAMPYLTSVSSIRDDLRQQAKIQKESVSTEHLQDVIDRNTRALAQEVDSVTQPYANALSDVRTAVQDLSNTENTNKAILALCDEIRDIKLFDLGIYLEDRDSGPALIRPLSAEVKARMLQARADQAAAARRKAEAKAERERGAAERAAKGKMAPQDMFRTEEFRAWDADGIPTLTAAGEEVAKSRAKKLRKDWERQKKAHEAWLATQARA